MDILERGTRVEGMHFLEASAGTGKTFAIEHLCIRLIIEKGLTIEQLLVVTFTRAATRELKSRIRSTLVSAREQLRTSSASWDYLVAIQEKGTEAVQQALDRIEAALICFDGAQIFTLHGFCHRMLSEFSFECRIASALASPEQVQPATYYKMAAENYLLYWLSPSDFCPEQIQIVLKTVKYEPSRLVAKIASLLSQETPIAPYPSFQELHAHFLAALRQLPPILPEQIHAVSACYKGMKSPIVAEDMAALAAVLHAGTCTLDEFQKLLSHQAAFLEQMCPEQRKVKSVLPEASHAVDQMRKRLLPLLKEGSDPLKILLRLASGCKRHAEQFLAGQECFSPDQMLHRLDEALEAPAFLEAIRRKYAAVVIDEFQDTDPIQWKIFKNVFYGHLQALCLVGDPKQSIYAFRSADVYTYLDAARVLGKENHKQLDTNFRSTRLLVDALNGLFRAPRGPGWIALPRIGQALSVPPVRAGSTRESACHLLDRGAIHFFIAEDARGRSDQWPSLNAEEKLFAWMACEIAALRSKRNLPFEEIAILVKDRFQAERLVEFLKHHRIPSAFRRGKHIAETDVFTAFKECLQAVECPEDDSLLKTALAGRLIGYNEAHLRDTALLLQGKAQMQQLRTILHEQGFGPFFSAFVQTVWPHATQSVGESGEYPALCKICELILLKGSDSLSEEQESQLFEVMSGDVAGSVAVMTMHLSKGLEFDTVFALGLCARYVRKGDEPIKKERLLSAQDAECTSAVEELDAEKMRALYVALTRAKQQLYIAYAIDQSAKPLRIGDAAPLEIFFAKISRECTDSEQLYEEIGTLQRDRVDSILKTLDGITYNFIDSMPHVPPIAVVREELNLSFQPREPLAVEPEWTFSFSALATKTESEPIAAAEGALPLGVRTGTIVHAIFEHIFKRGWHNPFDAQKIACLIASTIKDSLLAPFQNVLEEMVRGVLHQPLLPGRLVDIPPNQVVTELEFLYPLNPTTHMKGFADLIFLYEGKYYVLDWKTNYLENYTRESMEKAMRAHDYYLQANIYASALQRYVKLFDKRSFAEIYGGALYVFVRGNAVLHFKEIS
jgi:exodeoxyribonuclease V beta subunit